MTAPVFLPVAFAQHVAWPRAYRLALAAMPVIRRQFPAVFFHQTPAGRELLANFKGNQQ